MTLKTSILESLKLTDILKLKLFFLLLLLQKWMIETQESTAKMSVASAFMPWGQIFTGCSLFLLLLLLQKVYWNSLHNFLNNFIMRSRFDWIGFASQPASLFVGMASALGNWWECSTHSHLGVKLWLLQLQLSTPKC